MNICKEHLKTLWYEDAEGNLIPHDCEAGEIPNSARYQVSRFPNILTTSYVGLVRSTEVATCRHPQKYRKPTYGWIKGVVGRKCEKCHGTQIKKRFHFWPRKWNAYGSYQVLEGHNSWNGELVLAMTNSGDWSLKEAIIIAAVACERCMNVLGHHYGLDWGYAEHSEEWEKCGTHCEFCKEDE